MNELHYLIEMAEQSDDPQEIESGKKARQELARLRADLEEARQAARDFKAAILSARSAIRSTAENWQEQCLFDCDNILTDALKGNYQSVETRHVRAAAEWMKGK